MNVSEQGPQGADNPPADWYGAPQGYRQRRNGLGTASLVLGILSVLTIPTMVFGVLFGALAVIFGPFGRRRAQRGEATNGGVATTGVVLGAIGLTLAVGLLIFSFTVIE